MRIKRKRFVKRRKGRSFKRKGRAGKRVKAQRIGYRW